MLQQIFKRLTPYANAAEKIFLRQDPNASKSQVQAAVTAGMAAFTSTLINGGELDQAERAMISTVTSIPNAIETVQMVNQRERNPRNQYFKRVIQATNLISEASKEGTTGLTKAIKNKIQDDVANSLYLTSIPSNNSSISSTGAGWIFTPKEIKGGNWFTDRISDIGTAISNWWHGAPVEQQQQQQEEAAVEAIPPVVEPIVNPNVIAQDWRDLMRYQSEARNAGSRPLFNREGYENQVNSKTGYATLYGSLAGLALAGGLSAFGHHAAANLAITGTSLVVPNLAKIFGTWYVNRNMRNSLSNAGLKAFADYQANKEMVLLGQKLGVVLPAAVADYATFKSQLDQYNKVLQLQKDKLKQEQAKWEFKNNETIRTMEEANKAVERTNADIIFKNEQAKLRNKLNEPLERVKIVEWLNANQNVDPTTITTAMFPKEKLSTFNAIKHKILTGIINHNAYWITQMFPNDVNAVEDEYKLDWVIFNNMQAKANANGSYNYITYEDFLTHPQFEAARNEFNSKVAEGNFDPFTLYSALSLPISPAYRALLQKKNEIILPDNATWGVPMNGITNWKTNQKLTEAFPFPNMPEFTFSEEDKDKYIKPLPYDPEFIEFQKTGENPVIGDEDVVDDSYSTRFKKKVNEWKKTIEGTYLGKAVGDKIRETEWLKPPREYLKEYLKVPEKPTKRPRYKFDPELRWKYVPSETEEPFPYSGYAAPKTIAAIQEAQYLEKHLQQQEDAIDRGLPPVETMPVLPVSAGPVNYQTPKYVISVQRPSVRRNTFTSVRPINGIQNLGSVKPATMVRSQIMKGKKRGRK